MNITLLDAAAGLMGTRLLLRDRRTNATESVALSPGPPLVTAATLATMRPLLVCETDDDAEPVWGFRSTNTAAGAMVVGNERRGVAHDLRTLADHTVRIPLAQGQMTSLNVSAAAAVGLYHLGNPLSGRRPGGGNADRRRPTVLLLAATDHFELGSTLRSAAAFGWRQVLVDDAHGVWFGVDRGVRAEGRAAARRARNAIRLVRCTADDRHSFDDVVVVRAAGDAPPLQRTGLTGGDRQLVVLADQTLGQADAAWDRLGKRVTVASLGLPGGLKHYRYRLAASIALSEIARQLGTGASAASPGKRGFGYRSQIELDSPPAADVLSWADLDAY